GVEALRDEEGELFFRAVREAISNAVAHRSYNLTGTVVVAVRFPDVEITSPGSFPGGRTWKQLLNFEHVSSPTDAAVAWYLTALRGFEGIGRGFRVFEEFVRAFGEGALECEEDPAGPSVRIVIRRQRPRRSRSEESPEEQSVSVERTRPGSFPDPPSGFLELPSTTVQQDLLSGSIKTIGEFEVIREIGRGGMGVVFAARDPRLGRDVAIKVLPARYSSDVSRERFQREVRAASRLRHPGIVPVLVAGETSDYAYFVMELVEGESLRDYIDRQKGEGARGSDRFAEIARQVRQVADALHYAHELGIIHRDIKPGNILLDKIDRRPRLVDFGVSRDLRDSTITTTGEVMG
ncbi:MAG: protein kinase, partial [Cyanobacteria bacterium J06648_11]